MLENAGGLSEQIYLISAFCIDKPAYLEAHSKLGKIWRNLIGKHYTAMSMIFVYDLLDYPAKIELEATAVIPN